MDNEPRGVSNDEKGAKGLSICDIGLNTIPRTLSESHKKISFYCFNLDSKVQKCSLIRIHCDSKLLMFYGHCSIFCCFISMDKKSYFIFMQSHL